MVADNIKKKSQLTRGYKKVSAGATIDSRDAAGKQVPVISHGGQSSRSLRMGSLVNATISGTGDSGQMHNVMRPPHGMVATSCSPSYPICWPTPTVREPTSVDSLQQMSKPESGTTSVANRDLFTF